MKKTFKIIGLICALMFSANLWAQTTVGLRGGVNFASLQLTEENPLTEPGYLTGIDVALFGSFGIGGTFAIQPEIHWMQKGYTYNFDESGNMEMEMKTTFNFIEVPVLARFNFGTGLVGFSIFAGPSFGYALDGKIKQEMIDLSTDDPVPDSNYEDEIVWDDDFATDGMKDNRVDLSGVAGLGVQFDVGVGKVVVDARYNLDFTDYVSYEEKPEGDYDKAFNKGIALTAGFAFPIGQ